VRARRYQESRKSYDAEMSNYKPQKKKKDPNAPKQPLSAYFIFSTEERLKVKEENPNFSICDVAKELGKRWAEMDPALKQR
jgi:high mobility group protein B1